jgi:hypothetical protein
MQKIEEFYWQMRRSKMLGTALFILAICHVAIQFAVVAPRELARTDQSRDLLVYWLTAQNVQDHKPIYVKRPGFGPGDPNNSIYHQKPVYLYSPAFAAVIAPLGNLTFNNFSKLWFLLNFIAFWILAYALAVLTGEASLRRFLICALIAGIWPGVYDSISYGQVTVMLSAIFAVGLISKQRSLLWGIATLGKVFYVWPLIAHLTDAAKNRRAKVLLRDSLPAIAVIIALICYGGIRCGWESYVIWVRDILPTLSQGTFQYNNISLSFGVLRLARMAGWHYQGGELPWLPHLWLTLATIIAPLLTWWLMRRQSEKIKYAGIIVASALFAPICWPYYLTTLLPIGALLFRPKSVE